MAKAPSRSLPALRAIGDAKRAGGKALDRLSEQALRLSTRAGTAGRPRTAVTLSRAALALGRGDWHTTHARNNLEMSSFELGLSHIRGERFAKALRPLERALALHQLNGIEGVETKTDGADLLYLLGSAYAEIGQPVRASHCFGQETEVRQAEGDKEGQMVALANLGITQMRVGDLGEKEAYRAAAESFDSRFELAVELGEAGEEAQALQDRGYCLYKAGDLGDETLDCLRQAIEARTALAATGEDMEHELTRARTLLARCHNERDEPVEALPPLRLAIESTRRLPDCGCRLQALRSMADALGELNDPIAGERNLREAIAYCRAVGNKYEVQFTSRLGLELARKGDREAGLQEAEAAVQLAESMCESEPAREQELGEALSSLGSLLNNHTNRYEPAATHTRRSIEIAERLGADHDRARRLVNLGIILENSGGRENLRRAVTALEEALDACGRLGNGAPTEAGAHAQLGSVLGSLRETSASVHHYETAAELYRGLGDYKSLNSMFASLGAVPGLALGSAAKYLRQAASLSARISDGAAEAHALRELSRVRRMAGLGEEAAEAQRRGIAIIESARVRLDSSVDRGALMEAHNALYADAAAFAHRRNEDRRAFQYTEAGRARLTLDQQAGSTAERISDPELRERRRALAAEIGSRARRLEELGIAWLEAGQGTDGEEEAEPGREALLGEIGQETTSVEAEIEQLEGEWKQLESSLASGDPRYAARSSAGIDSVWTVPAVQERLLDDDSVLLEYLISEEGCVLFAVTREEFVTFDIPLNARELARLVTEMCRALDDADGGYPHGHTLYQALVAPAADLLAGKREVLICPDGVLHRLPFAALLREDPDPGNEGGVPSYGNRWATLPYLLQGSTHIRYIASATSEGMLREAERSDAHDYQAQLLALGAPLASLGGSGNTSFPPLHFAPQELGGILEVFGQEPVEARPSPHGDPPATRGSALELLERDPRGYRFVHLTTHALLDDRRPWLSALVFEPEDGDTASLGYLHANEAADLQLPAECVTLSGCRTRGDDLAAGEGVVGLALAFRFAGARSVCASLWTVQDESTARLMQGFYEQLKSEGLSPAAALASAQRRLIEDAYHPRHWASFGVFG